MHLGTSTWTIPKMELDSFPSEGTHLERYAKIFNAVEINTSFYKDHLPKSYGKWSALTPEGFHFSVKLHQRFTHTCEGASTIDLSSWLEAISHLEEKWKALLVQFPAGKNFNAENMNKMYKMIRKRFDGIIALEPRNLTWASKEAIELMDEYDIIKVIADPEKCPGMDVRKIKYMRLHGNPEIYRSNYSAEYLSALYAEIANLPQDVWCIFNNTTFGYATSNALALAHKQKSGPYGHVDFSFDTLFS